MTRKLKYSVAVGADVFEAGSTPPADAAKEITNPDAWESDGDEPEPVGHSPQPTVDEGTQTAAPRAPRKSS